MAHLRAGGRPEPVGVAGGEPAPVDVDLVVDELEVLLELGELGGHVGPVGLQEGEPFLLVAGSGGDELGVAPDGPDGPVWVNVPIVAAALVGTALFVPESRAARARRFDPVGQTLVILALGGVVYAVIESGRLGWTSPVILGLLAAAVLGVLGILGYEPRPADPLLELCLLPVGVLIMVVSPLSGRLVGVRGPRLPLVVAGAALALGGGASTWLGPTTPLPAVLAVYLLFGIFLGAVNPPITNTAASGMPASMAGLAASLASAGRQTGTTMGVAIAGAILGSAASRGGHQRRARRAVAGGRARPRHPGPGAAQHRALGAGRSWAMARAAAAGPARAGTVTGSMTVS